MATLPSTWWNRYQSPCVSGCGCFSKPMCKETVAYPLRRIILGLLFDYNQFQNVSKYSCYANSILNICLKFYPDAFVNKSGCMCAGWICAAVFPSLLLCSSEKPFTMATACVQSLCKGHPSTGDICSCGI